MKECRRFLADVSRPIVLAVLSMLLLGSSGSQVQTEVAERPADVSTASGVETSKSKAIQEGSTKGPKVSGYLQYHFNQPIDTNNNGAAPSRFRIQRARVTLTGNVNERVTYELDIDPRSPQLTGVMRDAFVDVRLHPHHKLRLGQHKVKFGYVNQRSSSSLYTVNRPEMAFDLSRGMNLRDLGQR